MPATPPHSADHLSPLQRFMRLVSNERRDIGNIYLFASVAGLISLSLPLGIQAIFNYVSGGAITTSWVVLVIVVIVGVIAAGLLQILQISITERIQQRIFTHSAIEFAFRIPRLQAAALRSKSAPELVNRFFDTLTVQKGFSKILMDLSASSLQILFGLLLLAFYHPFFIAFGVVLIGLLAMVVRLTGVRGLQTSLEESKYKYKLVEWLEEMARSLDTFKFAAPARLPLARTNELLGGYLTARQRHYRLLVLQYAVILAVKMLIIAALLVIGSLLVFSNELNVGQFVAMEIVILMLLAAVEKLIMSLETIYDILTALDKLGHITDLPLEREGGQEIPQAKAGIGLKLEHIHLQFPDQHRPALHDLNLDLPAGSHTNLVCKDTAFVTHFFRLLAGFYTGYEGSITLNGMPLANVGLDTLRQQVGGYSMLQEIFEGTLQDNITVGTPGTPVERVLAVIDAVGLRDFLQAHADGLNQPLRHSDIDLSVAIRRKVLLARALASNPALLLLHNPFHHMTEEERASVVRYIRQTLPHATILIASEQPDASGLCTQSFLVQANHITSLPKS